MIEKGLIQTARRVDVPHFINEKHEPVFFPSGTPILFSGLHLKWLRLHQISVRLVRLALIPPTNTQGLVNWIDFE